MSTPPDPRPYAGPADLARMEAALSASWLARSPLVNMTPGDLEWWIVLAGPGADLAARARIWPDGDDVQGGAARAYAWRNPPADVDGHQRADLAPGERARIVGEAIGWATAAAVEEARLGSVDPPAAITTWAMDTDAELGDILRSLGFAPDAVPTYAHWFRRLEALEAVADLPAGYRLRHVEWPADVGRRVEVHRAAFAPSRLTVEKYELLAGMAHYDERRDVVVEAPDGSFAAFTNAWLDPVARCGLLEPVGTHPDHRRRGLALAAVLGALHVLRDQGANGCLVLSEVANEASSSLYARAGFEAVSTHRAWRRPLA